MPQMAPISWLSLFIMFTLTYYIFNVMNYYNYFLIYSPKKTLKFNTTQSLNWKW